MCARLEFSAGYRAERFLDADVAFGDLMIATEQGRCDGKGNNDADADTEAAADIDVDIRPGIRPGSGMSLMLCSDAIPRLVYRDHVPHFGPTAIEPAVDCHSVALGYRTSLSIVIEKSELLPTDIQNRRITARQSSVEAAKSASAASALGAALAGGSLRTSSRSRSAMTSA